MTQAMILYTAPGFSSLADHIAMLEAGLTFDVAKVDIATKAIEGGGNLTDFSPKGYVPALRLADGELLTENVAILTWVADQAPSLAPTGRMGRYRLLETLGFIAAEIHKRFPAYLAASGDAQAAIGKEIAHWFEYLAAGMKHDYLFGDNFSAADAYLFVMLRGAAQLGFTLPDPLPAYVARIEQRPTTQSALRREGIAQ